jgi:cytochrome c
MNTFLSTIDWRAVILVAATFAIMAYAHPAQADQSLAAKNNCMACHAVDRKLVGPSYRDVANRYRGQAGAADKLAAKIRGGGSGVWGPIPMPPSPQLSESDARRLAEWVLKTP